MTGQVSMKNYFCRVNIGDIGFETLKKNALRRYPEADDIVNFHIDSRHENVFVFFFNETATINGIAVKYRTDKSAKILPEKDGKHADNP